MAKISSLLLVVIVALIVVGSVSMFAINAGKYSTIEGGIVDEETGLLIGPWADNTVKFELRVSDKFAGTDVAVTALVYDEEPADWNNPRGTFDDATAYTSYVASAGTISVDQEKPGTYYGVMTASGYNTEFFEFTIPDGTGFSGTVSDYNAEPYVEPVKFALVGSTTDEDFAFTLVNDSSAEVKDTLLLTLADDTEFRGWKAVVTDVEGFSLDADNDGVYDEGVTRVEVTVDGKTIVVFEPSRGVDLFDSNDKYEILLDGFVVSENDNLVISVEVDAVTGDYTGDNDEVWGEGEGVLGYIFIYDEQSNLFATVDVSA